MDTVKDNGTLIVIVNWSHQPETLYAETIMGTIKKLYDNANIAVIVDNSNTGAKENAPVSHAEAQYDCIAQGVQADSIRPDSSWYNSIVLDFRTVDCIICIDSTIHSHICNGPNGLQAHSLNRT